MRVIARHTLGLSDPIHEPDIPAEEHLNDGLPQSLGSCIDTYGLKHLKVKISGGQASDIDCLNRLQSLITRQGSETIELSLDGNERFGSMEAFADYWHQLIGRPGLRSFLERVIFIEQPLARDVALSQTVTKHPTIRQATPPIIIDKSDDSLNSASRAIELGYAGTSHKHCKGVFKSVANACMLQGRRLDQPQATWILSGEDLCNQGPISVMQDLGVAARLGISSIERNGHHHCRGLTDHPMSIQQAILEHHPDLYHLSDAGWPTLNIKAGCLEIGSVVNAPLGLSFTPSLEDYPFETDLTF